jgi:hypothetical protein
MDLNRYLSKNFRNLSKDKIDRIKNILKENKDAK